MASMGSLRVVGWGDALQAEINRVDRAGGLQAIVEAIDRAAGQAGYRGVRGSYAHLVRLQDPPTHPPLRSRAWLVVTALGLDADDWGVGPDADHPDDLGSFMDREAFAAAVRQELWGDCRPGPPASFRLAARAVRDVPAVSP